MAWILGWLSVLCLRKGWIESPSLSLLGFDVRNAKATVSWNGEITWHANDTVVITEGKR